MFASWRTKVHCWQTYFAVNIVCGCSPWTISAAANLDVHQLANIVCREFRWTFARSECLQVGGVVRQLADLFTWLSWLCTNSPYVRGRHRWVCRKFCLHGFAACLRRFAAKNCLLRTAPIQCSGCVLIRVGFTVPLLLPLLQREVDFEVRVEYGVKGLGLYICLYGRNTIESQSLPSKEFFCHPKSALSKSGTGGESGTLITTVKLVWESFFSFFQAQILYLSLTSLLLCKHLHHYSFWESAVAFLSALWECMWFLWIGM